jgi:hypothetical protein
MQYQRIAAAILTLAACGLPGSVLADPGDRHIGIPKGHLPQPGECRVWDPGVPPGQQKAPTDCRTAHEDAYYQGGWVVYGGDRRRDDRRW